MEPNKELLRAVRTVRPLPDVAHRVLRIVQSPDYSIDELVAVVRTDATLVARVLRLCNSARTGLDRPIASIGDAITFLGSRNLVQLVLVTCSAGLFAGSRGSLYSDPTVLWQHSVACAFACQAVATRSDEASPTIAFTVGILHDVGKIALSRVLDESRMLAAIDRSCADAELTHIELERSALGLDHAAAASLVAAQWQLPGELAEALSGHHDEQVIAGNNALPAILHLGDQLALRAGIGNAFPHATIEISPQAMKRLRLRESDVEPIAQALARELAMATELLNLDVAVGR